MERAEIERPFTVRGFEDVAAGLVKWPMSVIRLRCADAYRVAELADIILNKWREYDDPEAFIFHATDGERHNTITPIARRRQEDYELDLVLRNNITTEEHPLGVFHPHADKHHIKKENIGLIEVMGLAVLPARLQKELAAVAEIITTGLGAPEHATTIPLKANPLTAAHAPWALDVLARHPEMNRDNVTEILRQEVGQVFKGVLEDAGVFKRDEAGQAALWRFVESIS